MRFVLGTWPSSRVSDSACHSRYYLAALASRDYPPRKVGNAVYSLATGYETILLSRVR